MTLTITLSNQTTTISIPAGLTPSQLYYHLFSLPRPITSYSITVNGKPRHHLTPLSPPDRFVIFKRLPLSKSL